MVLTFDNQYSVLKFDHTLGSWATFASIEIPKTPLLQFFTPLDPLLNNLSAQYISGDSFHLSLSRTFPVSTFDLKAFETNIAVAYDKQTKFDIKILNQLVILLGDEDQTVFLAFFVEDPSKHVFCFPYTFIPLSIFLLLDSVPHLCNRWSR